MPRPPGHGPGYETRRQEIIDLAAEVFARQGYAATGIAELCEVVGLAKGALYYYIGSKENLLVEIQNRVLRPLLTAGRRIAALEEDPVLRLRLLSETLLGIILNNLDHVWVYEHDYRHLRGTNRSRLLRQRREFEKIVQDLLVAAMDTGVFRRFDPRLAMLQFLNLHNHTYQWAKADGPWDASFLSREYCATLVSGFCSPGYDVGDLEQRVRQFRERYAGATLDAPTLSS
ncbi:TetR/AcrR family transcriptional regulator [Sciscionella sediminilitoris]|uniref:TetR/AcrR family transcriptional regulator n=1 Tax=Sciscionella sediminilitoris TaxID=1445613 RepID=UPI0004DF1B32|nr:TetR/AcrR family transcriptional regulator [Sciscionella sp. SE31]